MTELLKKSANEVISQDTVGRLINLLIKNEKEATPFVIDHVAGISGWETKNSKNRFNLAKNLLLEARANSLHSFICAVAKTAIDPLKVDARTSNVLVGAALARNDFDLGLICLRRLLEVGSEEERTRWVERFIVNLKSR